VSSDAAKAVPVSPDADSDAARRAARDSVVGDQKEVDAGFLYAWHFFEAASDYADRAKHFMDRLQVLASLGSATLTPTGLIFVDDTGNAAVTPDRLVELMAKTSMANSAACQALTLMRIEKSLQKLVQQAPPSR
jgi:hypothetical protein